MNAKADYAGMGDSRPSPGDNGKTPPSQAKKAPKATISGEGDSRPGTKGPKS